MAASLEIAGNVAAITLNRPEVGNRIDLELAYVMADLAREVRQRDDVWVVVMNAEGSDFCLGTDSSTLLETRSDDSRLADLRVSQLIADIEKPVLCSVQGRASDQGFELVLACDLRIADPQATFSMSQLSSGLMPWDGGTQRLPRVVGRSRAIELLLTGMTLGASEAREIGLISEISDPGNADARALEIAKSIASLGPTALRYVKEAVLSGLDGTLGSGLRLEADLSFLLQSTGDRHEGISSFLERRAPEYRGN